MVTFIDQHRVTYGVEPICAVLPIAPSTYFLRTAQQQEVAKRSVRARRDADLRAAIQRVWDENDQVYGPRKVWKQLRREGTGVARCTIERLMRELGLRGVSRGRAWKSRPSRIRPPPGQPISSIASSRRRGRISSGSRISPTWPRGAASSTWRS